MGAYDVCNDALEKTVVTFYSDKTVIGFRAFFGAFLLYIIVKTYNKCLE